MILENKRFKQKKKHDRKNDWLKNIKRLHKNHGNEKKDIDKYQKARNWMLKSDKLQVLIHSCPFPTM